MNLYDLLADFHFDSSLDLHFKGIQTHSDTIMPGDAWISLTNTDTEHQKYWQQAYKHGAKLCFRQSKTWSVTYNEKRGFVFNVPLLSEKLENWCQICYPKALDLRYIGVTGTNGKSSVAHFIAQLASLLNHRTGIVGTLGWGLYDKLQNNRLTTPDLCSQYRYFHEISQNGAENVVMEISSHALSQQRVAHVPWDIAIFTNLSQDHMDYHKDMTSYWEAKKKLFLDYGIKKFVINIDNVYGKKLWQELKSLNANADIITYGLNKLDLNNRHIMAHILKISTNKTLAEIRMPYGAKVINSNLIGNFNISNLLAAFSTMLHLGYDTNRIWTVIEEISPVPGRLQKIETNLKEPKIYIDFAHTPDALKQVLQTIKSLCSGNLWCVFGCGGERDVKKRPQMRNVCLEFADFIVLTQDNSRNESPQQIIENVLNNYHGTQIKVKLHRKQAIAYVIENAKPEDIILIAGRGHENFLQIGNDKFHFNDAKVVKQLLQNKRKQYDRYLEVK